VLCSMTEAGIRVYHMQSFLITIVIKKAFVEIQIRVKFVQN
jgi:hypothetical protein